MFNVITTNTGAVTPDTDALNRLLQASTSNVPGSGMMIEPPHGNSEVKTAARRLAVGQSELVLDNGLITVVWTDPGGDVARVMPLSSDYGRTMDLAELPDRSRGNGKRLPFPDEYPRANAFHYHGSSNIDLDFEDMFRLVGYPGADRFGAIHNRGTGKIFLNDWRPSFFLELLPGEVFSFRATVDREGDRELVGVEGAEAPADLGCLRLHRHHAPLLQLELRRVRLPLAPLLRLDRRTPLPRCRRVQLRHRDTGLGCGLQPGELGSDPGGLRRFDGWRHRDHGSDYS